MKGGSWEKDSREEAESAGRKKIQDKWVFKTKHELDNTVRYKIRLCIKEFIKCQEQIIQNQSRICQPF